jgi:hypothetical protein
MWVSDEMMDAIGDGWSEIYAEQDRRILEEQEPGPWKCPCSHRQPDARCCSVCGYEPPWGCDCGEHDAAMGQGGRGDG